MDLEVDRGNNVQDVAVPFRRLPLEDHGTLRLTHHFQNLNLECPAALFLQGPEEAKHGFRALVVTGEAASSWLMPHDVLRHDSPQEIQVARLKILVRTSYH